MAETVLQEGVIELKHKKWNKNYGMRRKYVAETILQEGVIEKYINEKKIKKKRKIQTNMASKPWYDRNTCNKFRGRGVG